MECCVTAIFRPELLHRKEHPLLRLLRSGITVTVNTDNMTVSSTTIAKEFEILKECGYDRCRKSQLLKNSVEAAFLENDKKSASNGKCTKKIKRS